MEEETSATEKVKAIWYKSIPEDQANCADSNENESDTKFNDRKNIDEIQEKFDKLIQATTMKNLKQNFTFEYSYPAVIFDKVCFHIDKHQQQANFLDECLFKLKNCIRLPGNSSGNREKIEILKSINLSVPYGSIFGLLGPSSCGKTTLLRCLVGLLRPSSGSIRLFCECSEEFDEKNDPNDGSYLNCCLKCSSNSGDNLRRSRCKVPGPNVGYMPQDLGLYEDFTIRQLLTMFGQYMRMGSKLIANRIEFMVKFLDLPQVDREISSLSGGQKRRVSFAIACLHMPPLIILDEPTVGVDPLLRKSIWKYLRRLADEENKTIIITTHYIEEAAQADQVALMRAGEILVQDTPNRIMETNNCKTLEEAFLKICNNVQQQQQDKNVLPTIQQQQQQQRYKLFPQPKFTWHNNLQLPIKCDNTNDKKNNTLVSYDSYSKKEPEFVTKESVASKAKALEQLVVNGLKANVVQSAQNCDCLHNVKLEDKIINKFSMEPNIMKKVLVPNKKNELILMRSSPLVVDEPTKTDSGSCNLWNSNSSGSKSKYIADLKEDEDKKNKRKKRMAAANAIRIMSNGTSICRGKKFVINHDENGLNNSGDIDELDNNNADNDDDDNFKSISQNRLKQKFRQTFSQSDLYRKIMKNLTIMWALLYKNYRRNVNSLPLLAFQFMLPIIQMISFSLCVGGRPTNIGLGLVNHDQPLAQFNRSHLLVSPLQLSSLPPIPFISNNNNTTSTTTTTTTSINDTLLSTDQPDNLSSSVITNYDDEELLSDRYLSFVDQSMISIKLYDNLEAALDDVRKAKLWAAMEISENFTTAILRRFDIENFYQLDLGIIKQSVIRLYPDRSNKILDMICHRSLVNSYRQFLLEQFEQFKRLPIEIKEPIFSIKPNIISNSIDGYTESIAAGLLASLTYIMAAGLTTFIMVVERSAGILERTFTSGINPIAYLIAHAAFRSVVMMLQIAVVLFLTFYILQQPLVGSIWLAYVMLMTLNLTGISYGLLISSIVTDQNGAALTIVSSLVVKITLSGILWPFEAIPRWLRAICYIQPLTMPIQALKNITLKGATLQDRSVQLGFLVSLTWLLIFLTVSAKRFKFYQH